VDEGIPIETVRPAANGAFALSLPAGNFFLRAQVLNTNGYHQTLVTNLIRAGCLATSISLNITTASPVSTPLAIGATNPPPATQLAARNAPRAAITPGPGQAGDCLPKPRVFVDWEIESAISASTTILVRQLISTLDIAPHDVVFLSVEQFQALGAQLMQAQLEGGTWPIR
jgi:hypothetical protein